MDGLDANLRLQDRAAQALRERRHEQGALSLESSGAQVVFDGETLADVHADEKNRAKALIEDFMIAANGATAAYLEAQQLPSIRRILRAPRRWDRIVLLAREVGAELPPSPDGRALDEFLRERRRVDPDRFPDLSLSVVKLLGSGEYAMAATWRGSRRSFRSRRSRLRTFDGAQSALSRSHHPAAAEGRDRTCAVAIQPRRARGSGRAMHGAGGRAEKIERQVRKSAAALLLAGRIGQRFDAIVTGASEKGTWVRIRRPAVEGRVVRGQQGLDVGERTRVELLSTDVERGFIDFGRV